jgi:hypothetical protein
MLIARICEQCGKEFKAKPYRVRKGQAKFCSPSCYTNHNCGENNPNYKAAVKTVKCLQCGSEFTTYQSQIKNGGGKYCSYSCKFKYENSGSRHYGWKGGKYQAGGYVAVSVGMDCRRYEHQLVAEKVLGRPLKKGEVVHHINGNKTDNRNTNLLICSNGYHHHLHQKMAKRYQMEHFGG